MVLRLAVVAILATVVAPAADKQSRVVPLPADRRLSIDVTVGAVSITGESRPDALIEIVRSAPSTDLLSRIPVHIEETPAHVQITAVQTDGSTDPALRTDVMLRVPRAAALGSVRVMEGRLTLTGLTGSITADVRRGPIEGTDLSGVVRLETGIGDVTIKGARLSGDGLLRLRAFNGDVRLHLAKRPADARLMALALNGTISSDIPLRMRDTWGPRWGEATLGKGEPVISLDVITGRIQITAP